MKRLKILLSKDGNFHFDDVDEKLYNRLIKEGILFQNQRVLREVIVSRKNLQRRMANPEWWQEYLESAIKWAEGSYMSCMLCHLKCGKNRFKERGLCRASNDGEYFDLFIHPGMEMGLEKVLHIMMTGCSLNCFFCHKDQERNHFSVDIPSVTFEEVISTLRKGDFKYVAFSGGNPDENILAILKILKEFKPFPYQILWETHGCVDKSLLTKLLQIVDLFIITVKCGNNDCAIKYCDVENYNDWIRNTLSYLKRNDADILMRLSKIPGHETCCYPAIEKLGDEHHIDFCNEVRIFPEFNLSFSMANSLR